jgi:hypothetical protein
MDTAQRVMTVTVDRDSVCAGDDCEPHAASFEIAGSSTIMELLQQAHRACPLASIAGGRATWLIDTAGYGKRCVGVVAQQWDAPRLTIPETTTVEALFGSDPPTLFFRYWCQADPEAVFEAVRSGVGLPARY